VTDGKDVYVALTNGVVASYSLDGKRNWLTKVELSKLTYGPSASPVLAGGKLLIEGTRLTALDPATGKEIWKASEGEAHYGTLAIFTLKDTLLAVTAKGTVVRISDGAVLAKEIAPGLSGDSTPSPVVQGNIVYFTYLRACAVKLTLADGKVQFEELWDQDLPGAITSSPILKDGMLFVVPYGSPEYRVLDASTGKALLEKDLEIDPIAIRVSRSRESIFSSATTRERCWSRARQGVQEGRQNDFPRARRLPRLRRFPPLPSRRRATLLQSAVIFGAAPLIASSQEPPDLEP
jgi:outer membrane protein assembly factor BamB